MSEYNPELPGAIREYASDITLPQLDDDGIDPFFEPVPFTVRHDMSEPRRLATRWLAAIAGVPLVYSSDLSSDIPPLLPQPESDL